MECVATDAHTREHIPPPEKAEGVCQSRPSSTILVMEEKSLLAQTLSNTREAVIK